MPLPPRSRSGRSERGQTSRFPTERGLSALLDREHGVRHLNHRPNTLWDSHPQLTTDLTHVNPSAVLNGPRLFHSTSIRRRARACSASSCRARPSKNQDSIQILLWVIVKLDFNDVSARVSQLASHLPAQISVTLESGLAQPNMVVPINAPHQILELGERRQDDAEMPDALLVNSASLQRSQMESQLKSEEPSVEPIISFPPNATPEYILVELTCRN